jgi:myo-inositol catabolism protein IolS
MENVLKVGRFDVIQPCHNLFWRFMEKDELSFCIKHEIGIVTYSPLAQGLLTGKYLKDRTLSPTDGRANSPLFLGENFIRCVEAADALKPIAKKYNKTTGQLAIAWALSIFGITSAIVGAKNANQMLQNIGGMGFVIESEDLIEIDKIGRTVTDYLPHYKSFFNSTIVE